MNTADPAGTSHPAIRSALAPITAADRPLRITPLGDRAGFRIEGELDHATLPVLTRALTSVALNGSFCVDLSGLLFIDVGGLRALLTAAARLPDGQVMTLRSVSPVVKRLLDLTGWHQPLGLRLLEPPVTSPDPPRPRS